MGKTGIDARTRRALKVSAGVGLAALALREFVRPRPGADRRVIDWDVAARIARDRCGESGSAAASASGTSGDYARIAGHLVQHVGEICGTRLNDFPPIVAIDRHQFIDANLTLIQRLIEPVEQARQRIPHSYATALGRKTTTRYVGEILGFVSHRVLGQYDPVLRLTPAVNGSAEIPTLYIVDCNLVEFANRYNVPLDFLRQWVVLHELTHAWQFGANPWLTTYINGIAKDLVADELMHHIGTKKRLTWAELRRLPATVRGQLRGVQRIQAVMSVLEGHGNFVMHRVGRQQVPDFERLERAFTRRKNDRPILERLILAITGLNIKMRQYDVGEQFANEVTERAGLAVFNRVWHGQHMLPSPAELHHPDQWILRTA